MSNLATLLTTFKGDLVVPGDKDYPEAIARWALNAQRSAKVVAFVKGPEDVVLAIKYAKENGLPLAIRGGGHSPSGASSAEGGLVIDLSRHLASARVDPQQKLAYVGGGALWGTVDKAAIEHGLATVGGTVNHTGVGGLTVGGGFGWLAGRHGLTVDNLQQATVVTANGSILTASDTENPDLFFAIRGGGSNFGVVTEFVLRLHPQRRTIFAGAVIFTPDVVESVASAIAKWWENPSPDSGAMMMLTHTPDGKPSVLVLLFYNGSEAEGREHFKDLLNLHPVVDQAGEIPYENLNALQNPPHGRCYYMKGLFQDRPEPKSAAEVLRTLIALQAQDPAVRMMVSFEYVPLTKIRSAPAGAAAFRRDYPGNALVISTWEEDTPAHLTFARDTARTLSAIVAAGQQRVGLEDINGYGNYDTEVVPVGQDAERSKEKNRGLYGNNYARLQELKKKYDPELVFNKWFPIEPAA